MEFQQAKRGPRRRNLPTVDAAGMDGFLALDRGNFLRGVLMGRRG